MTFKAKEPGFRGGVIGKGFGEFIIQLQLLRSNAVPQGLQMSVLGNESLPLGTKDHEPLRQTEKHGLRSNRDSSRTRWPQA